MRAMNDWMPLDGARLEVGVEYEVKGRYVVYSDGRVEKEAWVRRADVGQETRHPMSQGDTG